MRCKIQLLKNSFEFFLLGSTFYRSPGVPRSIAPLLRQFKIKKRQ